MMRYGVSFGLADIFFTHFHADHVIGVIGLLRTMSLQGRTEPLRIWGPRGAQRTLKRAEDFGMDRLTFPIQVEELDAGKVIGRKDYSIVTFPVDHRGSRSLGYALVEEERKGRFNPELARSMGIPEGPLWGEIHRGRTVTLDDGRVIEPSVLVGAKRPGRRVVVTGDTRPCAGTIEAARGADLLVHEATFGHEEHERAVETGHSTAREAACVARDAGVRSLVLTHFSARYSRDASDLVREARECFENTVVGRDGLEIEVEYPA
jgi:ribonuclease Z